MWLKYSKTDNGYIPRIGSDLLWYFIVTISWPVCKKNTIFNAQKVVWPVRWAVPQNGAKFEWVWPWEKIIREGVQPRGTKSVLYASLYISLLYIYKNELLSAHITGHQSRTGWGMQNLMMGTSQEYAWIDYANLWLPYLGPFTRKMHFFHAQRLRDLYGWNVP